ncbi:uncharacterized protein [Typha latifolia]|uniref:uncharacterized protein n=1 Tax=Typha latifolia TaxID=4733 RepID=UPI003C2C8EA4
MARRAKRKDLEEMHDDFADFSLSSPARKIRRLDAELPPIMEDEPSIPSFFEQHLPRDEMDDVGSVSRVELVMNDALTSLPLNDERALVLYKSADTPVPLSPDQSIVSLRVSADLIRGLKNQVFGQGNSRSLEDTSAERKNCLAVVPWVPSQVMVPTNWSVSVPESPVVEEPMEAEVEEGASMEIEEEREHTVTVEGIGSEGFHQWQQHCMTPQFPTNQSSTVMWSS